MGTRHFASRTPELTRNLCQPNLVRLPQPARHTLNLTLTANKRPHSWLSTGSKCKSCLGKENSSTPCSQRTQESAKNLALQAQRT